MEPISIAGAFIITVALLLYGIGSISVQRFKIITPGVLVFISLGVLFDLVAVTFMIVGSSKGAFTAHGILGYSATLTMVIDLILIWRSFIKRGLDSVIEKAVLLYSKFAYGWWIIAYITGSLMIIWQKAEI
ncbi:MAG TPA: hypothetical protein VLA03_07910 [Draconibacterium sp.]|nr:hypothetical protein [Draconibacterium sp.]